MNETTHPLVTAPADSLHAELRALIASIRQRLAGAVNAELTRLYWAVSQRLRIGALGGADRAKYGDQLIKRVGDQLAQVFGRGSEAKNLRRTADEKTEVVANCDHLQNLKFCKALPLRLPSTEPPKRPIGFLTHWPSTSASRARKRPLACSYAPSPATNR